MISRYEAFKQTIKQYIQSCGLDIGIVYFIMKDIFKEIENLYYAQLNKEAIEDAENQKRKNMEVKEQTEEAN